MKRKEIYFDKETFNYQLGQLNKIVESANKYNAISKNYIITLEDIKLMIRSKERFLKERWNILYSDVCNLFGVDIEMIGDNEEISKIADNKFKSIQDITNRINRLAGQYWYTIGEYIGQDNKGNFIVLEQCLKEDNTEYTNTEKENKILDDIRIIYDICKKYNISKREFKDDIFYNNMEINPYIIRRLGK